MRRMDGPLAEEEKKNDKTKSASRLDRPCPSCCKALQVGGFTAAGLMGLEKPSLRTVGIESPASSLARDYLIYATRSV